MTSSHLFLDINAFRCGFGVGMLNNYNLTVTNFSSIKKKSLSACKNWIISLWVPKNQELYKKTQEAKRNSRKLVQGTQQLGPWKKSWRNKKYILFSSSQAPISTTKEGRQVQSINQIGPLVETEQRQLSCSRR